MDSRYILKGELTGFPDRLDVGYERKRKSQNDSKTFCLSICKDGVTIDW